MKKILLIFMLLIGVVAAQAREPYGDYICRYIVEDGRYHVNNNPIKITHYGIQVKTLMPVQRRGRQTIKGRLD